MEKLKNNKGKTSVGRKNKNKGREEEEEEEKTYEAIWRREGRNRKRKGKEKA